MAKTRIQGWTVARSPQHFMSALCLGLAALVLTGCVHGAAADAGEATETKHPAQAATPGPAVVPPNIADTRACAGVQAAIGHLSVSAARWSPNLDPFNKAISAQIRLLAKDLDNQASQARTPNVREVVHANAHAFTVLADAMGGKNQASVRRAVDATRTGCRGLTEVCSLD
jgi:hypothetical protein